MPPPFRVGILTVSDTASADSNADRTGPHLAALFDDASTYSHVERSIVPDDIRAIQVQVDRWSHSGLNLCITTGGTGFSDRDITPEAIGPLLYKHAFGLEHLMMSTSLSKTPMAALSRPVAGVTKDGMIVVTVPGSPRGARENVEALLGILPHALDLASGGTGRDVHRSMGVPARITSPTSPISASASANAAMGGGTSPRRSSTPLAELKEHSHLPTSTHSLYYDSHRHRSGDNTSPRIRPHSQPHSRDQSPTSTSPRASMSSYTLPPHAALAQTLIQQGSSSHTLPPHFGASYSHPIHANSSPLRPSSPSSPMAYNTHVVPQEHSNVSDSTRSPHTLNSTTFHPSVHTHDHSHSHNHVHNHNHDHAHRAPRPRTVQSMDVSKGASGRHRKSPYRIISMEEAFALIFDNTPVLGTCTSLVNDDLLGFILAEDVYSSTDLPSTMTTNVDGYAVCASETSAGTYPVITSSTYPLPKDKPHATILNTQLPKNVVFRINTGAPLPLGTDAVVMVEDTELVSSEGSGSQAEEKEIKVLAQADKFENVRKPGSDAKRGERVLEKGIRISEIGGEIGTLAFVGKREVLVQRRPVVAIMSTGNELSELHPASSTSSVSDTSTTSLLPVVYDSNRPSLSLILRSHGFKVVDLGIVPDTVPATTEALKKGAELADMIIATGGTSMGEADLLKPVIERELAGTVHFGQVAMKPGKPTTFGTFSLPSTAGSGTVRPEKETIVFALPGNPASAIVTFHVFVLPCLRKMSGYPLLEGSTPQEAKGWHLPTVRVQVDSNMPLDPRPEFHRVWIEPQPHGKAGLLAKSTGGQRSSRTVSLAGANGLVCLPSSKAKDARDVKKGEIVDAIIMGRMGG